MVEHHNVHEYLKHGTLLTHLDTSIIFSLLHLQFVLLGLSSPV
jgi:hypothetical protein